MTTRPGPASTRGHHHSRERQPRIRLHKACERLDVLHARRGLHAGRPHPPTPGPRARPFRLAGVRHGPVRRGDRPADGQPPGAGAGAGRRGCGRAAFAAGAALGGRARPGGGGVEPDGGRGSGGPVHPRAVRGAGGAHAGGGGRALRGGVAHVRGAERARQPPGPPAARARPSRVGTRLRQRRGHPRRRVLPRRAHGRWPRATPASRTS